MRSPASPAPVPRPRRKASRRAAVLVGLVVLVGFLFVGVFPTRTYLAQRRDLADTERRVEVLASQNRELAERVARLNTDAEIERLAREQYNLVRPGEEAYALLPAPRTAPDAAADDPESDDEEDRNLVEKAWDALTGLF